MRWRIDTWPSSRCPSSSGVWGGVRACRPLRCSQHGGVAQQPEQEEHFTQFSKIYGPMVLLGALSWLAPGDLVMSVVIENSSTCRSASAHPDLSSMAALLVQKHSVPLHACSPYASPWRPCRAWGAARFTTKWSLHAAAVKTPQELQLGVDIPINVKTVQVGERTFQLVVPCIDTVMEAYILAGQADRDPYW